MIEVNTLETSDMHLVDSLLGLFLPFFAFQGQNLAKHKK